MKRKFLHWLYKNNEALFADIVVEEFFGKIPDNLKTPAVDFLAKGQKTLERFFSIQAYHIQRRAAADIKNQAFYDGQLMYIKALILAVSKTAQGRSEPIVTEPEKDPVDGVKEFIKGMKKING